MGGLSGGLRGAAGSRNPDPGASGFQTLTEELQGGCGQGALGPEQHAQPGQAADEGGQVRKSHAPSGEPQPLLTPQPAGNRSARLEEHQRRIKAELLLGGRSHGRASHQGRGGRSPNLGGVLHQSQRDAGGRGTGQSTGRSLFRPHHVTGEPPGPASLPWGRAPAGLPERRRRSVLLGFCLGPGCLLEGSGLLTGSAKPLSCQGCRAGLELAAAPAVWLLAAAPAVWLLLSAPVPPPRRSRAPRGVGSQRVVVVADGRRWVGGVGRRSRGRKRPRGDACVRSRTGTGSGGRRSCGCGRSRTWDGHDQARRWRPDGGGTQELDGGHRRRNEDRTQQQPPVRRRSPRS